ncbi:MAG: TetR/AcrR family transcriptional regulator [Pseudomonadota bacterium]
MEQSLAPAANPDDTVRERLLRAAVDLFAEKGYTATSIREIVAAAGVTKPVLYYYFHNKKGLYHQIMDQAAQRLRANLAALSEPGASVWERLLKLADLTHEAYSENLKIMKLMLLVMFGPPHDAPFVDFNALYWQFHQAVETMVAEGIQTGEMLPGDPPKITWVLMGTVHLALQTALCQPERSLARQGLVEVLEVVHRAFWASHRN